VGAKATGFLFPADGWVVAMEKLDELSKSGGRLLER